MQKKIEQSGFFSPGCLVTSHPDGYHSDQKTRDQRYPAKYRYRSIADTQTIPKHQSIDGDKRNIFRTARRAENIRELLYCPIGCC